MAKENRQARNPPWVTRRPGPAPPQTPTLECTEHTQTQQGSPARSKQPLMHMKPGTQTNCAHNQIYTEGQTNIISLVLYWFERYIRRLMHCKLLLVLLCYCHREALNKKTAKDFKFLLFVRKNRSVLSNPRPTGRMRPAD